LNTPTYEVVETYIRTHQSGTTSPAVFIRRNEINRGTHNDNIIVAGTKLIYDIIVSPISLYQTAREIPDTPPLPTVMTQDEIEVRLHEQRGTIISSVTPNYNLVDDMTELNDNIQYEDQSPLDRMKGYAQTALTNILKGLGAII